jgi:hypothetical protein
MRRKATPANKNNLRVRFIFLSCGKDGVAALPNGKIDDDLLGDDLGVFSICQHALSVNVIDAAAC